MKMQAKLKMCFLTDYGLSMSRYLLLYCTKLKNHKVYHYYYSKKYTSFWLLWASIQRSLQFDSRKLNGGTLLPKSNLP